MVDRSQSTRYFRVELTELQLGAVLPASLHWEAMVNKDAVLTEAIRALMEAKKGIGDG